MNKDFDHCSPMVCRENGAWKNWEEGEQIPFLISNSIYKSFLIIKWVKRIQPDPPNPAST